MLLLFGLLGATYAVYTALGLFLWGIAVLSVEFWNVHVERLLMKKLVENQLKLREKSKGQEYMTCQREKSVIYHFIIHSFFKRALLYY